MSGRAAVGPTPPLRPAPGVISRDTEGGIIILDAETGACYEGNRTAALVWTAIVDGSDLPSVCRTLSAEYDVPADRVEQDVALLVETLSARGLLATDS